MSRDDAAASASVIAASTTSGYHLLKIQGYSTIKATVPNGKFIESRSFRVAGRTWAILYYPNGSSPDSSDHVSLYLRLKDDGGVVMARWRITFNELVNFCNPRDIRTVPARKFDATNSTWGYARFLKPEILEQWGLLKRDCFTVRCDIEVLGETETRDLENANNKVPAVLAPPPPDWPRHFRALLQSGQGADVRFLVENETFAAHRCVLAARSPVFRAELYGDMMEAAATTAAAVVQIDDMRADVFENLLHFIYTDSLQETSQDVEEEKEATTFMAQHLLVAADRYGMDRLKLICEDKLCRHLRVSTLGTTLVLAEQHHCKRLKDTCFEFIRALKKLDGLVATGGFQHLAKSCPSVLSELIVMLGDC